MLLYIKILTFFVNSNMIEDINTNPGLESKKEAELFALVKSIINLNNKYQKGKINDNFFKKALKNAMNNLFKLNLILKEKNLLLADLLEKMHIAKEYHNTIDIINRVSSLNLSSNKLSKQNRTFLELPGLTSEITSSFITLMDALTLNDLKKHDFIINLFEDLTINLSNFPGVRDILLKIEAIQQNVLNNIDKTLNDAELREKLIDEIYLIFKEFQTKLDLNP
ncbi:hypothetical protein LCGC14_1483580 [marine sediment metagenome]|uniref:Uncharacterized protein n=2 Tax=unclassified sequences TaxID=12908 RepID=A0A0F9J9F3_9ZZZZ|nr:putative Vps28-like protein [uncultured organism]